MHYLFEEAAPTQPAQESARDDPRTSFRQVQQQDAIIWTATLYHSYAERIAANPNDAEARDWFFNTEQGSGTFESWCRLFGQDADTIRQHIKSSIKTRKLHE